MINLERRGGDFTCENMMLHDASAFFANRGTIQQQYELSLGLKIIKNDKQKPSEFLTAAVKKKLN